VGLRKMLDGVEHHFQEGGRFQKWYALYEVFERDSKRCRGRHN